MIFEGIILSLCVSVTLVAAIRVSREWNDQDVTGNGETDQDITGNGEIDEDITGNGENDDDVPGTGEGVMLVSVSIQDRKETRILASRKSMLFKERHVQVYPAVEAHRNS